MLIWEGLLNESSLVLHLFAVVLSTVMQALLGFALMFFSRLFKGLI